MDLSKSKLVVIVPIVVSILAATFGSVKYIINLTETIEENKQQVMMLNKDIQIIFDKYGRLDIAVNNAGVEILPLKKTENSDPAGTNVAIAGGFLDETEEDFDEMFGVNVKGVDGGVGEYDRGSLNAGAELISDVRLFVT